MAAGNGMCIISIKNFTALDDIIDWFESVWLCSMLTKNIYTKLELLALMVSVFLFFVCLFDLCVLRTFFVF